jgi:O-antigen ligase
MKKLDPCAAGAFAAAALLFYVVVVRLGFAVLPLFFLALGFVSYAWSGRRALILFLFFLPLVNSTPGLFFNGYPFNYIGIALFYLSGILAASRLKKEKLPPAFPGRGPYLLFLALLGLSVLFVFLRWSNLGLSSSAFLRDTPVAPSLERVSFACIFPVISLALFALTPFLVFLVRRHRLGESEIFVPLKAGLCLSFLLALAQKWVDPGFMAQSWWGQNMKQLNGGFSDFNAFGFFAGAMFLFQALKLIKATTLAKESVGRKKMAAGSFIWRAFQGETVLAGILFLAVALAAVFLSGCRTAFLFVLLALIHLALSKKIGLAFKATVVVLMSMALVLAGGMLGKRLQQSVTEVERISSVTDLRQAADTISNGRLSMLRDGARMIGRFPVSGVGAGNFLFYLKYLHFGKEAYFDLPLNQYLLFFSETGLAGGLAFLFFLVTLLRKGKPGNERFVLAAMAVALLFNNFFWFPEVLLLFWVFVARMEWVESPSSRKAFAWGAVLAMAFSTMNILEFRPLHPETWARETATAYDYGFSYLEKGSGRPFRWTGAAAGLYVYLDKDGRSGEYGVQCGAPLPALKDGMQTVDIYWRGKPFRRVEFRENREQRFHVEDRGHREGFLEFRVRPAFNLKEMGLGEEPRDLGVQMSGPDR